MKIVVGVDGSKYGRWALEWMARIPFRSAFHVTALHVLDIASLKAPFMVQPAVAGNMRVIQREIDRMVKLAKRTEAASASLLSSLHLKGKAVIVKGVVAPSILGLAPGPRGLLVVGSRGLTPIDRFMLGSVSTHLTTHTKCPILVVKQPARPLRRLLFATDGSKSAEKALQFIIRELKPGTDHKNVEIVVLHAILMLPVPELRQVGEAIAGHAAQKLAAVGFRVSQSVHEGDPADQIMEVAKKLDADLIVTGAKGLGAIARFLLGSVSTKLVQHSTCSVLIVR